MNMKKGARYTVTGALIAAVYAVVCLLSSSFLPSFGPIQFRPCEALCVLPILYPSATVGLTIGCAISNFASPFGIYDVVFGSLATLISALLTRLVGRKKPILSFVFPVVFNSLLVGIETMLFLPGQSFALAFLTVALGEALVIYTLGLALYLNLKKNKRILL